MPLDAGYLKAALQAAVEFTARKAVVKQYTSPNQIPAGQSWLFWLSDAPLDNRLLAGTANVFKYENGKIIDTHTSINPGNISLTKRINAGSNVDALWTDGFGKAVLNHEQKGNTNIYHFLRPFQPRLERSGLERCLPETDTPIAERQTLYGACGIRPADTKRKTIITVQYRQ
jgi:hypothetical protein